MTPGDFIANVIIVGILGALLWCVLSAIDKHAQRKRKAREEAGWDC